MTITVKKIALSEQQTQSGSKTLFSDNYLNIVGNLEVECLIRLGTLSLTISELRQLKLGQTFKLESKNFGTH